MGAITYGRLCRIDTAIGTITGVTAYTATTTRRVQLLIALHLHRLLIALPPHSITFWRGGCSGSQPSIVPAAE